VSNWRLIPFHVSDAFENMAADEAIFRLMPLGHTPPTLRFYGWRPAAVSLGYFQNTAQACNLAVCRREGIDVVRRPTGGRAVLHDGDLTYALCAGVDEPPFPPGIAGAYRVIGRCLQEGLHRLGIDATPAPGNPAPPGVRDGSVACFARTARDELLVGGRKICGSAQARSRGAFLQHGSLLVRFDAARASRCLVAEAEERERTRRMLTRAVTAVDTCLAPPLAMDAIVRVLAEGFAAVLHADLRPGALTDAEEALKARLKREKYRPEALNGEGEPDETAAPH
jgi:lipoate-protein ligase A